MSSIVYIYIDVCNIYVIYNVYIHNIYDALFAERVGSNLQKGKLEFILRVPKLIELFLKLGDVKKSSPW